MSHDLRHALHDAASALEAIAREVGHPDAWVDPARAARLGNRLAGIAATLHEAATLDEQAQPQTRTLTLAPEWTPEPDPAPVTTPLSQADPPRPRCPICDGWLVLCQVMPPAEDEPDLYSDLALFFTPAAVPGVSYVWRCANAPHLRRQP